MERPADTFWRVEGFGNDHVVPGTRYWHENAGRQPAGTAVFQLTLSGELTYREGSVRRAVPADHALLFEYDEDTAYGLAAGAPSPYCSAFVVLRGAGLVPHWRLLRELGGSVIPIPSGGEITAALQRLTDMARPQRAVEPTAMAALVHDFVMRLFRLGRERRAEDQSPVHRAVDDVLQNPLYPWSLKELAAEYGISREYFSRIFHGRTGQPPGAYLAAARRERAVWLLRNTRLPIHSVARHSGFTSTHTLARQVRGATGLSPSQLRSAGAIRE